MLFQKRNSPNPSFQTSIGTSVVAGTGACILFYGLIVTGPLDFALLRRYCLCHPVAIANAELFFVTIVALATKWFNAVLQHGLNRQASLALEDISLTQPDTPDSASGEQKALWFDTLWRTQSSAVFDSWLGQRVAAILQRQIKRKNTKHLDQDVRELAERDADQQHESYGLIRIVTWGMLLVGFLGSVLGISNTLGQMAAQALASGSQAAMNSLTVGLHVAIDSTAFGILLTMIAMSVWFVVNRSELSLLAMIDRNVFEALQLCLAEEERVNITGNVDSVLSHIAQESMRSVQQMVQTQSELWQTTLSEQARAMHQQQREMTAQTELLNLLIEKHEAIAVLGTQMERYGYLGRQPIRRRVDEPLENASVESVVPTILSLKRNAG